MRSDGGSYVFITIGVVGLFVLVSVALNAAILSIMNKRFDEISNSGSSVGNQSSLNSILAQSIRFTEVMDHLNEFYRIAVEETGNRAVNTRGFNRTLDYITNYLSANTNFKVTKTYFPVRNFQLAQNPIMITSINGTIRNRIYSTDLSVAEFYHIQYSTMANFSDFISLTAIPNVGCSDADWLAANPLPAGRVALVKRGDCDLEEKGIFANKYNVAALLLYNDGSTSDRIEPIVIILDQTNAVPALSLSFNLGQELVSAAQNPTTNAGVRITIDLIDMPPFPVGNICADTLTGDVTQTIVVGSHSDSVSAGPGINDNGSGSAANLAMAVALARLFQTSTYATYQYRVRFCWWAAEETGLLGSDFYVKQARNSTIPGERITDNLANLNFDMLGSPNYVFGIYDGRTIVNSTPSTAIPGSNKISELFREWFNGQKLPWDNSTLGNGSDYAPFLAAGVAAGGVNSGAGGIKSKEQCDRYASLLGRDPRCVPNVAFDACYHRACDTVWNINMFAYEKIVQAAAYGLESLARKENLKEWLYPTTEIRHLSHHRPQKQRKYNSINEYFGMPYS